MQRHRSDWPTCAELVDPQYTVGAGGADEFAVWGEVDARGTRRLATTQALDNLACGDVPDDCDWCVTGCGDSAPVVAPGERGNISARPAELAEDGLIAGAPERDASWAW